MARKTAGYRYPHATTDAREHDHRMCLVVQAIADRATAGTEPWGTRHPMPLVPTQEIAKKTRARMHNAKFCRQLEQRYGELMSVKCDYEPSGDRWQIWVQVWPRSVARAEITRRVRAGEGLAYNPYKEKL